MKTAGVTLGVVGSFLALYGALITFNAEAILKYPGLMEELSGGEAVIQTMIALRWVLAFMLFMSAVLGAVGAAILSRKGTVSGTMLVIASVFSAVTVCGALSAVCFALSGIFAFVSDKRCALKAVASDDESEDYDMGI